LINQPLIFPVQVLPGCRDPGGIADLTAPDDRALCQQWLVHAVKQSLCSCFADPALECPDRRTVWDVARMSQSAKALATHPVQQRILHLLTREVVEPFKHQDSYHRLRRKRRTAALRTHRARSCAIHLHSQRRKVDARFTYHQRIALRIDLPPVSIDSKQVSLDRASRFHQHLSRQQQGQTHHTAQPLRDEIF
jgi:hypothetical protein